MLQQYSPLIFQKLKQQQRLLLRISLMTAVMFMFVASTMAQKIVWEKFTSTKGKFSVMMPGKPEISKSELDSGGSVNKISAKVGDGVCFASYTELDYSEGDQQELAQIGLQAFVQQLGADLSEAAVWKVGKEKGRINGNQVHDRRSAPGRNTTGQAFVQIWRDNCR